jgi:hypothetical protein
MSNAEKDTAASPEVKTEMVKPPAYLLLMHRQRDAENRATRASRGGHRRQGVLLDDGTRVRQRGYRYTQIGLEELKANHQSLLEHVRQGRIGVFMPDEKPLSYDELVALLHGELGDAVKEESLQEVIQNTTTAPPTAEQLDQADKAALAAEQAELLGKGPEDVTRPDVELSETLAAADMAEENKKLPAAPTSSKKKKARE